MSFLEFYSLTPREFNNKLIGYRRKEEEETKLKFILNYDLQRVIVTTSLLDKKDKEKLLKQLQKFPWENQIENQAKRVFKSKEELSAIFKKADEAIEQ